MTPQRGRARPPVARRRGPSPFMIGLVAVVIVAGIALVAVAATSDDDGGSEVGEPAPALEGTDALTGEALTIPSEGAKLVVFLAHWCPHCQAEVPLLVDWIDSGGVPEGVEVYGVATSNDPNADNFPADEWLEREGWAQPTLLDEDDSMAAAYGVEGFPYLAFVDESGEIVETLSGEQPIAEVEGLAESIAPGSAS